MSPRIASRSGDSTRKPTPRPSSITSLNRAIGGGPAQALRIIRSRSSSREGGRWWNRLICAGTTLRSGGKCRVRSPSIIAKSACPISAVRMIGAGRLMGGEEVGATVIDRGVTAAPLPVKRYWGDALDRKGVQFAIPAPWA